MKTFRPSLENLEKREVFSNVVLAAPKEMPTANPSCQAEVVYVGGTAVSVAYCDFNNDGRLDLIRVDTGNMRDAKGFVMLDGNVRSLNGQGLGGTGALAKALQQLNNQFLDDLIGWDYLSNPGEGNRFARGLLPYIEQDNLYKVKHDHHDDLFGNPKQLASVTDLVIDPFQTVHAQLIASNEYFKRLY